MTQPRKCTCHQETKSRPMFGRVSRISIVGCPSSCAKKIIDTVFDQVEDFESSINGQSVSSELYKLYAEAVGSYVPVSNKLWSLLQIANDIAYRTDGMFDIAAAGTDGRAVWTDIDLSRAGSVRFRKSLSLSLGGLNKGFAVDIAVKALQEMGVGAGLVDIGGCIRSFGPREWRVEFNSNKLNCHSDNIAVPVALLNSSLAGLGAFFGGAHVFDAENNVTRDIREWQGKNLVVRSKLCCVADALTKVAVLSEGSQVNYLQTFGAKAISLSNVGFKQS